MPVVIGAIGGAIIVAALLWLFLNFRVQRDQPFASQQDPVGDVSGHSLTTQFEAFKNRLESDDLAKDSEAIDTKSGKPGKRNVPAAEQPQRPYNIRQTPRKSVDDSSKPQRGDGTVDISAASPEKPKIEIVKAVFGTGRKWVDVTDKLREILATESTAFLNSSRGLKVADPLSGYKKKTRITYRVLGKEKKVVLPGGPNRRYKLIDHLK